jgi:hypothetical protein
LGAVNAKLGGIETNVKILVQNQADTAMEVARTKVMAGAATRPAEERHDPLHVYSIVQSSIRCLVSGTVREKERALIALAKLGNAGKLALKRELASEDPVRVQKVMEAFRAVQGVDPILLKGFEDDLPEIQSALGDMYLYPGGLARRVQDANELANSALRLGRRNSKAIKRLEVKVVENRAEALAKVNELKGDIARIKTELENLVAAKWDATAGELSKLQMKEKALNDRIVQLERQLNILLTGMTDGSGVWVECDPPPGK